MAKPPPKAFEIRRMTEGLRAVSFPEEVVDLRVELARAQTRIQQLELERDLAIQERDIAFQNRGWRPSRIDYMIRSDEERPTVPVVLPSLREPPRTPVRPLTANERLREDDVV